jgi:hypothetical protein
MPTDSSVIPAGNCFVTLFKKKIHDFKIGAGIHAAFPCGQSATDKTGKRKKYGP